MSRRPVEAHVAHAADVGPGLLAEIAGRVGTPAYVYDARAVREGALRWVRAIGRPDDVFYSVKANGNLAILSLLRGTGVGAEVATPGELARARRAGFAASRILVGGVPKAAADVERALHAGVDLVILQAAHEVEAALAVAAPERPSAVGLRVRPGIRAGAHPSLETARVDAKFGLAPDEIVEAWRALAERPGLRPTTLAVHLGSGLGDLTPYARALDVLLQLSERLRREGGELTEIDVGGGLGIDYASDADPDPVELAALVRERIGPADLRARFEPGRSMVGRGGLLLTRVLYRRERGGSPALVCDAGYTDFGRYALYGAEHRIEPLDPAGAGGAPTVEVLGPLCESGDVLGTRRRLHNVRTGDLLVVRDAGAYGFVMASQYNGRPRPAEVLVEGDAWRVVRRRESPEDLWRGEEAGEAQA